MLTADAQPPAAPTLSIARAALATAAGALCLVAVITVWDLVGGAPDSAWQAETSALATALATLCALAGATVLARGGVLGQATIGVSMLALVCALVLLWVPDATEGDVAWRALAATVVPMFAGAHTSLLRSRLRAADLRAVHLLTDLACGGSAILTAGWVLAALTVSDGVGDTTGQTAGVLLVLTLLATLLTPLARKLSMLR